MTADGDISEGQVAGLNTDGWTVPPAAMPCLAPPDRLSFVLISSH